MAETSFAQAWTAEEARLATLTDAEQLAEAHAAGLADAGLLRERYTGSIRLHMVYSRAKAGECAAVGCRVCGGDRRG